MNEQTEKFLDDIGITTDIIANLKDPGDDLDIEKLSDDFKSKQREVYANDPDVIKELDTKAKGKARGSVERKIKKIFGISNEEWNDNELEKDYEKALTFGFDKMRTAGSKSVQDINTELQEANTKIKWYDETEIPRIQQESDEKADKKETDNYLREVIANSGKLGVSEGVATIVVNEGLRIKGYKTGLNETKTGLIIKTKDDLSPQDDDKTRNLSNKEVVGDILEKENLLIQSNADPDPNTKKVKPLPVQGEPKFFVHQDALDNVEDLKDMKVKGQK